MPHAVVLFCACSCAANLLRAVVMGKVALLAIFIAWSIISRTCMSYMTE